MRNEINDDNRYKEGTIIYAKIDPKLKLIITKYRQRVYYCAAVEHPEQDNFAYFEKELIPPSTQDQRKQFVRVEESVDASKNYAISPGFSTLKF